MRLFSRKNLVFLETEDKPVVRKIFNNEKSLFRELIILNFLRDRIEVPKVISTRIEKKEIFLEYIEGTPFSDLSIKEFFSAVHLVVGWLRRLHSIGIEKGDCNPRNFILNKGKIYGLDFEEAGIIIDSQGIVRDLVDLASTSMISIYHRERDRELALEAFNEIVKSYGPVLPSALEYIPLIKSFLVQRKKYRPELAAIFEELISEVDKLGEKDSKYL
ncbi:MAG: hypothetical protein QW039_05295 [Fervidicoccaceae archaeon]